MRHSDQDGSGPRPGSPGAATGPSALRGASCNGILLVAAGAALLMGLTIYLLDRAPAHVYFLSKMHWPLITASGPGRLAGSLPSLLHVYAFILLSVAVSPWPRRVVPICGFWWLVDTLFEVGQHPALAPHIVAALPAWFQHVPVLDNTGAYFLRGHFDPWDLAAVTAGTLAAYLTIYLTRRYAHERAATE